MYPLWMVNAHTMRAADISCVVVIATFVANLARAVTLSRHSDISVNPGWLRFLAFAATSFSNSGEGIDNVCNPAFSTHNLSV